MTVTQRRSPTSAKVTAPIPIQVPDPPAAGPADAADATADEDAHPAGTTELAATGDRPGDADGPVPDAAAPAALAENAEPAGPRPARYGLQMPRRRPGIVWLVQTVTLGLGHLRWLRRAGRELADLDERATVDTRRTTLAIVPGLLLIVPPCLAWYRLGHRIAQAQYAAGLEPTCRPSRGVLLAFAVGAVTPYYQRELNKIVDWYGFPADTPVPLYD